MVFLITPIISDTRQAGVKMKTRVAIAAISAAAALGLFLGVTLKHGSSQVVSAQVGSLMIWRVADASQGSNEIDQSTAVARALSTMTLQDQSNGKTPVKGYTIRHANRVAGLKKATTTAGSEIVMFSQPADAWVIEFSAPTQAGWANVSAIAVIDAKTGEVRQFSENMHN